MGRVTASIIALAAVLAPASLQAADVAPPQAMLDSFRAACERMEDFAGLRADAERAGFEAIPESSDARVVRLNQMFRDFATATGGRLTSVNYRTANGGHPLFLYLARWEDDRGRWGNTCRLHDFEAATPIDMQLLDRWSQLPPPDVDDQDELGLILRWDRAWRPGIELQVIHIPQARRDEQQGLVGNVVGASIRGGD